MLKCQKAGYRPAANGREGKREVCVLTCNSPQLADALLCAQMGTLYEDLRGNDVRVIQVLHPEHKPALVGAVISP